MLKPNKLKPNSFNGASPFIHPSEHIVVAARLGSHTDLLRDVLEAEVRINIEPPTVETVAAAIEQEASLVILTEEVLSDEVLTKQLGNYISGQPAWSDIPIIILLNECQRFRDCLTLLGETTHHRSILILELPLKQLIFSTIVKACLHNRRRQYALRNTIYQLQASNQALENFSYTAAHELRNPLGIAKTSFDLLARTPLEPQQRKFVDMGQRTTDSMNQLIEALLNYSKIQTTVDDFTTVAMTAVAQEAVDSLQALITERQATVSIGALPTVNGNRQLLVQLMSNLIKNAIIHNTANAPEVTISAQTAADVVPNILTQPAQSRWSFFVTDNGPGIAPENQTNIFNMFNRSGQSEAEGSGIGLALCQRVAQQHQSVIHIQSAMGEGSTFYFDLDGAQTNV